MFPARPVVGRRTLTAARRDAGTQTLLAAERPGPADNARPMSSSAARLEPPIPFFIPTGDYCWDRSRGIVFALTKIPRRHAATNRPPAPLSKSSTTLRAVDANARPKTKPVSKTSGASQSDNYGDELDEKRKLRAQVQQDAQKITELERRLDQTTREAKQWQSSSLKLQEELGKERAARQAEVAQIRDTHSSKLREKNDLIWAKDAGIKSLEDRLKNARVAVRNEIIQEAHAEGLRIAEQKHEERHVREMRDNLREVEVLKSQNKREVEEELKRGKEHLDREARQKQQALEDKHRSNRQKLTERHRANQLELAERHRAMRAEVSERERQAARDLAQARTERQEAKREREELQEQMREEANKTARSELLARQVKFKGGYKGYRDAVQPPTGSSYYYALDSQAGKLREQSDGDKDFGKELQTIPAQIQSRVPDFSERYTKLRGALDKHAEAQVQSLDNSMPTLHQYDQEMRRGRLYGIVAHTSREITNALRYTVPSNRDMAKLTVEADILWPLDARQKAIESELKSSTLSRNQYATQERRAAQIIAIHGVVNLQQEITEFDELLHAPYAEKIGVVSRLEHAARYRHVLDNYKRVQPDNAADQEMDRVREHIAAIRHEQADLNHIMHRRGRLEGLLGIQNQTDEERINAAIKEHLKELEAQLLFELDKVGNASPFHLIRARVQRKAGTTNIKATSASASTSSVRSTSTFQATAKRASAHVAFTSALSVSDMSRIWPAALTPAQDQEERPQCAVTFEMSSQHGRPPSDVPLSEAGTSMLGNSDARHQRPDGTKDLVYSIADEDFQAAASAPQTSPAAFWSYKLYRSPSGATPMLHYCTRFDQAEEQAQKFLGAAVLGFDIEWESGASIAKSRIKDNVSLIQIATEDRIGLFQLGLFKGDTMEELMPPSLRTILESPATIKAGVNIAGDATRLRTCLGVNMCGLIELSHLYRIVRYSEQNPAQVNRRLVAMAEQVQDVLRLPLSKDTTVRTGAWSRKLNVQQCDYAGSDAYAGLQLYYELESQREKMQPTPPRPAFYELFQPLVLGDGTEIPVIKTSRPRASAKAGIVDNEADADEAYFDAVESLEGLKLEDEDATQLGDRPIRYPSLPVDLVRDPARSSSISQPVSATKLTADKTKRQPPPKSAEVDRADSWMAEWKASLSSGYKLDSSDQKLRAYHLWHEQGLDVKQVGAKIGDPPLANMTVAKYVLDVVKDEGLAYDAERIKQPLNMIPMYLRWRFQKIAEVVGL